MPINNFNINKISSPKIQHRLKNKNDLTQLTTVNGCMKIYNANTNQKKAAVTVLHLESADFKSRELSKD